MFVKLFHTIILNLNYIGHIFESDLNNLKYVFINVAI